VYVPAVPAATAKLFDVPAEKPLYWPLDGSFTVSDGDDTKESVLIVHDEPTVATVTDTLVPVVARDVDVLVLTEVRHCVSANAENENARSINAAAIIAVLAVVLLLSIIIPLLYHVFIFFSPMADISSTGQSSSRGRFLS
jgi:hypothetical protein